MLKQKTLLGLLVFLSVPFSCYAATTYKGTSGMINTPSAHIGNVWNASVGYFHFDNNNVIAGNFILPYNTEVSYARNMIDAENDFSAFGLKTVIAKEKVLSPAIAIGVEDIGKKFDRSFYLTTSKQLPMGFKTHVGVRSGKNNGLFYGIEKQVRINYMKNKNTQFSTVNFILEYDGNNANYGAYFLMKSGLRLDVSYYDNCFMVGLQLEVK